MKNKVFEQEREWESADFPASMRASAAGVRLTATLIIARPFGIMERPAVRTLGTEHGVKINRAISGVIGSSFCRQSHRRASSSLMYSVMP